MPRRTITCPDCNGKAGRWTTGDGYEEWDECHLCNPDGDNDTGRTTKKRVAEYRKQEAAEAAYWDAFIEREREHEAALDREYGPAVRHW